MITSVDDISPAIRNSPSLFAHFILGVTPHATQSEFLECRSPVKTAACGRRWGKSVAAACDVLHLAVTGLYKGEPTKQMVIAPTGDQTNIICDEVERLIMNGPLSSFVQKLTHRPFFELTLNSGAVVMARSAQNEGKFLRGRSAHRVVVDEAAFVSERTVQEAIIPMLADYEGQLVLISSPFGRNYFYQYFMLGKKKDQDAYKSFQFTSMTNPHISQAYISAQRMTMTNLQFQTEWMAEFLDDQASVFKWGLIERAARGEEELEPIPGHQYVAGWDPAKYFDRSAFMVMDTTAKPYRTVRIETMEGRDYSRQITRVADICRLYNKAFLTMDCTGNAALLEQMKATGARCEGLTFTTAIKNELIDSLVISLEQDHLIIPAEGQWPEALINELRYYEYKISEAGNIKLGAPDKRNSHDDLVTSLALAHWAAKAPFNSDGLVAYMRRRLEKAAKSVAISA